LTRFGGAGYPRFRLRGGTVIPDLAQHPAGADSGSEPAHDLDRLQRAIERLVERHRLLREENARLRALLDEREHLLLDLNQRRQDASKRIDDLIARIDELDARFESEASE
jgi:septal ring factor EnvC (AmiA/AmiB activator)